ncbi:PEP-CTERM system TPR-repeat protein PrsT [Colwellia sp. MB3u-70]|uniref:XrtA/PEP-CTERM system TPR-repeat protein PrsT n=1 Tax=unclassified Colwellia TaxID=196834 RepID=UPI0015F6EB1F|nr:MULTISPECIES: XrtA/PEP-CTERM system TPR-repeat protein PrsT [unclassified Colwellia]MBA6294050.1 PEP-CTERM system TPR-repeat protein PrsT [Colwellia sp. MB3u-8]MBA6307591.1 PEP-CTERM system TPR-repeat protein PrsT [Colwellia sp. MB3u-70]
MKILQKMEFPLMPRISLKLIFVYLLIINVMSCSDPKTVAEYMAEAQSYAEKRDYTSAIIVLKNAINLDSNHPQTRYLLGVSYLEQGNYVGAEKELERALALSPNKQELVSKLVQVKYKLGKYDYIYQVADNSSVYEDDDIIVILTYAGIASINEGKDIQAKFYVESALAISDSSMYGQIGRAYISHSENDFQEGLNTVETLLATAPNMADAIMLKGYLLQATEQFELAAQTFSQYAVLRPKDIQVRFFIAQNYIYAQNFDAAELEVDRLLKVSASHPLANQFKAEIEFSRANYQAAQEYALKSLMEGEGFHISKIIAGVSSYKLGDLEQAYNYLNSVKAMLPAQHIVRQLIIEIQLQLGYEVDAIADLRAMVELNTADPALLTMASNELLTSGKIEVAEELLQYSLDLDSKNPDEVAKQGLTQLFLNKTEKGIENLEKALKLDPNLEFAEQSLVMGYLKNSQFTEALVFAKKWQSIESKKVQGYLLESLVFEQQGNLEEAEKLLYKVIEIDENNTAALFRLAIHSHKNDMSSEAFNYYTKTIKLQPQHHRAMIYFTRLIASSMTTKMNLSSRAIQFYHTALEEKPSNNYLKFGLALIHNQNNTPEEAIELFKEIEQSTDPIVGIELALGDSYRQIKDWRNAERAYQTYNQNEAEDLQVIHKLFSLYEQMGELDKALALAKESITSHKDKTGLVLLKVYYQSLLGEEPNAQDLDEIKANENIADHWFVDKTFGHLAYRKKDFEASSNYYNAAYNKQPSEKNAMYWAKSASLKGDKAQAVEILEAHVSSEPLAIRAKMMLAAAYIIAQKPETAIATYKAVLLIEKNNSVALNNLANLELQQNNTTEALHYAKKALTVNPTNADFIDTYAQVLIANGQIKQAIEQYDLALSSNSAPKVQIIIHKAEALIADSQSELAKSFLTLIKTQQPDEREKINKLLREID